MADVVEYKCPACGGAMEFNSKIQKMKCPYCDTEMSLEDFEKLQKESAETKSAGTASEETMSETDFWNEEETEKIHVYVCESCGGEIIADDTTGATSCPYCGNRVVMKGQFTGDLKPDYIIPFKKDKKDAKQGYLNHLKRKSFLPKVFKKENHIDEIKGVYVPFWLFDADVDASIDYDAKRVRTWESGDTEYTETSHYKAKRAGSISFDNVPEDGSEKMDDSLMESIEPYDFKEAVDFKSAYLAGYVADRYDVKAEECIKRAKKRMKRTAEQVFMESVTGYDTVSVSSSSVNIENSKCSYALYPAWILNTTYKGQKYVFAMNGQTGRVVGNLPVDKSAFWKSVSLWTVVGTVAFYLIFSIFGL